MANELKKSEKKRTEQGKQKTFIKMVDFRSDT